jgi:hypothetical protein
VVFCMFASLLTTTYTIRRMFLGSSSKGIEEEVKESLYGAQRCRNTKNRCLAVPATSLLHIASALQVRENHEHIAKARSFLGKRFEPEKYRYNLCRGILPMLKSVVKDELETLGEIDKPTGEPAVKPDSHINPLAALIDPYGR